MRYFLYSHGGSGNHGCEAIVRGTKVILNDLELTLYSNNSEQDQYYGLNQLVRLKNARRIYPRLNPKRILASMQIRLFHNERYATRISIDHMWENYGADDVGISIGGDNYCYPGYEEHCIINEMLREKGIKTVLWGCSVEPSMLSKTMRRDMLAYEKIIARESITYNALKEIGAKVTLRADPAFLLPAAKSDLPFKLPNRKVLGMNISPVVISCEKKNGIAYRSYSSLIDFILRKTDYHILLIPHVVWKANDDREVNKKLYEEFGKNERITLVPDQGCEKLKHVISCCNVFIGARTHATIAAYSSCVPTLAIGYSVKARGIARDIFGTEENYVLPIQDVEREEQLRDAFLWLQDHEEDIRKHLEGFMPGYIENARRAREDLLTL